MVWNLQYDISAWFVFIILIAYYASKRNLPIQRNYAFFTLMISSFMLDTVDIIASYVASYPGRFPQQLDYVVNILYYSVLAEVPFSFSLFCAFLFSRQRANNARYIIQAMPMFACIITAILTPWTKYVFYLDIQGVFHYGPGRIIFFYETMFYLAACLYEVTMNGRQMLILAHRFSLYTYIVVTAIGHVIQVFFQPYAQVVSLTSLISTLAVFLTFQGPDYYRERRTGFFDARGLQLTVTEDYRRGLHRPFSGFIFENYGALKNAYTEEIVTALLRQVATYVRTIAPKNTTFYLQNGVFLGLLGSKDDAIVMRDQLNERFQHPFVYRGNEYTLRPRFFYDSGLIPYESYEELRATVWAAISKAREDNNASSVLITEQIYEKARQTFAIERATIEAIVHNAVDVYYQPIISAETGKVVSAEALARISDRQMGIIMPDDFIPIAEHNGSISRLGEQVFAKVCEFVKNHDMEALGLDYIEVNLSPIQCARNNTAQRYLDILKEYGVDPSYINLEITETENTQGEVARDNILRLSSRGVDFALDDYGTGYSNMVNTIQLPYSIIKLDRSLVNEYYCSSSNILLHLIHHFNNSGKQVVAEGIETEEMRDALVRMGCSYLQGFYYSPPLPQAAFLRYVEEQNK